MKKLILLLLTIEGLCAQKTNSETVTAEASYIIPLGDLKNKFDYAHSYSFWVNVVLEHGYSAGVGIAGIFFQNPRPIDYTLSGVTTTINSNKFGLDFGIRVSKKILFFQPKNYLEADCTVGLHYLDYDFPKEKEDTKKKDTFFPNTTLLFAPEIKYIHKNVGLKVQYRITPFNFIDGMEAGFGWSSVAIGLVYKQ